MSWIQTRAGLQMAETITRYLPRIVVCLEELAKKDGTFEDIPILIQQYQSDKEELITLMKNVKESLNGNN